MMRQVSESHRTKRHATLQCCSLDQTVFVRAIDIAVLIVPYLSSASTHIYIVYGEREWHPQITESYKIMSFCRKDSQSDSESDLPVGVKRISFEEEFKSLQLQNIKRVATLGMGGFGRVELVGLVL